MEPSAHGGGFIGFLTHHQPKPQLSWTSVCDQKQFHLRLHVLLEEGVRSAARRSRHSLIIKQTRH